MSLTAPYKVFTNMKESEIRRTIAAGMVFGQYVHEFLMVNTLSKAIGAPLPVPKLTPRELECLRLGAQGLSSKDIAICMKITVRTVQLHFDSVRLKLGAANRQEAVALAIKQGIIVV
jgi:DNA-binding CsgD family transcriptional regulator